MKKIFLIVAVLALGPALAGPAAASLEIQLGEAYATGEPVMIMVNSDQPLTPTEVTINVQKPDGSAIPKVSRQEAWTGPNSCYDTYTIEMNGQYTVTAVNNRTQDTASATFTAAVFSPQSFTFFMASVIIFVISMLFWLLKVRGRRRPA